MTRSSLILFFTAFLALTSIALADEEITTTTTKPNAAGGTTTTVRKTIVTTAPSPKVVVTIPPDYANCFTVNAGWFGDLWVAEHQVCQYPNSSNGLAWIDGYWQCSKYTLDMGVCTSWDWVPAHWVTKYQVY